MPLVKQDPARGAVRHRAHRAIPRCASSGTRDARAVGWQRRVRLRRRSHQRRRPDAWPARDRRLCRPSPT